MSAWRTFWRNTDFGAVQCLCVEWIISQGDIGLFSLLLLLFFFCLKLQNNTQAHLRVLGALDEFCFWHGVIGTRIWLPSKDNICQSSLVSNLCCLLHSAALALSDSTFRFKWNGPFHVFNHFEKKNSFKGATSLFLISLHSCAESEEKNYFIIASYGSNHFHSLRHQAKELLLCVSACWRGKMWAKMDVWTLIDHENYDLSQFLIPTPLQNFIENVLLQLQIWSTGEILAKLDPVISVYQNSTGHICVSWCRKTVPKKKKSI